ncbi:glycosyltransferase [Endozoicomonas sp.]|uniref:glycosyltransferase n=1 Tax=Endozoicomonas sp. TaxID=1892382 RepID=UPI003AF93039
MLSSAKLMPNPYLQKCETPESAKKGQSHITISTEGYRYCFGGLGAAANSFCKIFTERGCRVVTVLPLVEIMEEKEAKKSITHGYLLKSGEQILVERCSDMHGDVYRLQPTNKDKKYFEHHENPYGIEPSHRDTLMNDFAFKEGQNIDPNDPDLKAAAAISMKLCAFNRIAPQFVNEVILPTMQEENVYVHDHYFGGSLSAIETGDSIKKINWVHGLIPHMGFSDCMIEKDPVYTTEGYQAMTREEIESLPEKDKPIRERAIKHSHHIITVSDFARKALMEEHDLFKKCLPIHGKVISSIKSYSDLAQFNLSRIAKHYGVFTEGMTPSEIKSAFKAKFFARSLPVLPPEREDIDEYIDKPILLFMGRPCFEKGTQHVLNMIRKLDCLFFIISRGTSETQFIKEVIKIHKERNNIVLLTEDQRHKQILMAIANIGVIPSLSETYGLITGECGSMGMHVITSDIGGLTESSQDCGKCRTIVHSDAKYGEYSEVTNRKFLETVGAKLTSNEVFDHSHITEHTQEFHSPEQYAQSIEKVLMS